MLTRIFKRVYTVIRLDSSPIIFTRGDYKTQIILNTPPKSMDDILEEMLISNLS